MIYAKKKSALIWIVLLMTICLTIASFSSYDAKAETEAPLLYFVNCGEDGKTPVEEGLRLEGSLGTGNQEYTAGGWGYVGNITQSGAGSNDIFLSKASGDYTYKFDVPSGEYMLSLGISEDIKLKVNGDTQRTIQASGKKVEAMTVTVAADGLTLEFQGSTSFIALLKKDSKVLLYAEAKSAEVLDYGAVVDNKAIGYFSDGSVQQLSILYKNLSSAELNSNFSMAEAVGVVEGTEYQISQKIVSMPTNLTYFVNCGSQDSSSEAKENDIYYELNHAIRDKFQQLKNAVPDQEYSNGNEWGYTPYYSSAERLSSKQMPSKLGDPYPPSFPYNTIRCISGAPYGIEYTFKVDPGKYNVYIGTRSHWHSRSVKPYINDVEKGQLQLDATNRVNTFLNESDSNGTLKVRVTGNSGQDEGSIAYIAIQPASEAISAVPKAPVFDGELKLGETEFTVKGVTKGAKVQVSLADSPYSVIYESVSAEGGDHKVTLNEKLIDGVFKLRLAAVTSGGVSEYKEFFITDISDFTITPDTTEWTLGDVTLSLSAKTQNSFVRLEVTHNYFTQKYEISGKTFSDSFTAKNNGKYEFKLFSDTGSFYAKSFEVTNIDNTVASLNVALSETGWSGGKIPLKLSAVTNSEVVSFQVYKKDQLISTQSALPQIFSPDEGQYRLSYESAIGKIAALAVHVTKKPSGFEYKTVKISDGKKTSISGKNGRVIEKVFAYEIDGDTGRRLTVTSKNFEQYSSKNAGVLILYKDGSYEAALLDTQVQDEGLSTGAIVGLSVGIPLGAIALGAGGFLAYIFIKKKRGGKA